MEAIIIFVTALLVVLATSLVKNVAWSNKVRHLVATVVSVIGAAVAAYFTGDWQDGAVELTELAFTVYGASQLLYNFILRGTALNETLETHGVTPSDTY